MYKKLRKRQAFPGRLTVLTLSLAAALVTMASTTALAGPTVIGSATVTGNTSSVTWNGSGTFLINNGVILSGTPALTVSVTSGTVTNNGTVTSISNSGNINVVNNNSSGTISGGTGINNTGTIGTLTNTGTITGTTNAIFNSGTITNPIANNGGTIAGNITNTASQNLTLTGGTGSTFGTLTGSGSGISAGNIGLISNTASNLVFSAGNQLLNDNIDVAGHTAINSGSVLQINNTINVTGNYTQNAAATLNIGVANGAVATGVVSADSGYGRLVVSGVATFDAGTSIALKKLSTYSFAQGQRFVVVQANNGSAQYNADLLNYSADGYSGSISGASVVDTDNAAKTDLVITLAAPGSGSTRPNIAATTTDVVSALSGLFRYGGTNADMLSLFNPAAALSSTGEANRAGAQLSPAASTTAAIQSAQVSTQTVVNLTTSHIDTLRTAQVASGVSTGERADDIALWGQFFGGQANQGNRAGASGYRAGYSGLLIGADTALNDQWRLGGVFSYADTSVNSGGDNTGSSAHIKSYGLTGYGGYTAETWYLNLSGGIVRQKYNTQRSVGFTGFSGNAAGQFDGTQYVASVQAGYPIKLDAMTTLTPIAGLTYSRMTQDAYTETGSVAALYVNSSGTSSLKSDLGAKLERTFKTSYGEFTPSAQLSWRHEYRDTSVQSVANFAADTSGATSFTTQGAAANTNTGVLVLGATLARSQNLILAAHYTLEAARGYTAQTADVRLRYQF